MVSVDKINLQILRIKNLPDLPASSMRIIDAVNNPDISIEELTNILSLSPVLVARLLGLANSAYFGHSGEVSDLKIAIMRVLGMNLVKSLTLGVILNLVLDTRKCRQFNNERLWMEALFTAILSQQFSRQIHDEALNPTFVYTAGLLLNIGVVAAVYLLPEETNQIFLNTVKNASSVSQEMSCLIGMNQYQLGGILLQHWHLPMLYQTVLKEFKNSEYDGNEKKLIDLLHISFALVKKSLANQNDDFGPLVIRLEPYGLSVTEVQPIIDTLLSKKDNIYQAALAICGKSSG